ncbi:MULTISPECIES: hypothetical protein [Gordonia]|uniref:hypothetical protein n=1 Tax=Gordonia TaxID=2053 RepID=UPI00326677EE
MTGALQTVRAKRIAGVRRSLAATTLAVAVCTALAGTAEAAPARPPAPHQVASAPYGALFALGAPVYERVMFIKEPDAHSRTMIMRRLHRPTDGKRGSARYVFLGDRLPESFLVSEDWSRNGTPQGLVVPLTRKSRGRPPTPRYQSVTTISGPVGEIRAIAWSHRYLG